MIFSSIIVPLLALAARGVQADPSMAELEGTWSSKSNTVFTGSGFYDPVDELLIEPDLPGISYSFTSDGFWEAALYRVTSNPQNHSCPSAVLIYQHGSYELLSNGSLVLTPIAVDGRQLLSEPCTDDGSSVYSRYVQATFFKTYEVYVDGYNGRWTLQIYQFDGSKMQPLYLAYKPPNMLPTTALNPTDSASETKTSLKKRARRSLENQYRTNAVKTTAGKNYDFYWWVAVSFVGIGSASFFMI
ncbi:protein Rot1p [[Candida] railenensis]|uniref:Protein ROT1 n=1 Tax=[Candida] railenensis TaxID=45579 RepID=A0A9P0QVU7_9ASCO|nr:protein Rot1p [[Candida] railenensis]